VAEAVAAFLSAPTMAEHRQARRLARAFGSEEPAWRPLVQPHHSITPLAMVGGGSPPRPGEITRANGGVLVLDELLEFNPSIQESLREPLESGVIRLARASEARTYPARFALVATTNLCPCGQYDPFAKQSRCHCSRSKRERHLARLSRPFLDRAHILAFTGDWREGRGVLSSAIKESVDRAKEMRERRGQLLPNARVAYESLAQGLDAFAREQIVARPFGSARRSMAILRVARTLADLDGSKQIETGHWSQAMRWCACSFERLAGSV
jgi:magnesium chelatase family protein